MKKRFFAGILALCMLLTMLPMAAFAAEEPAEAEVSKIFYWAEKANIMADTGLAANNTAPYTISI